MGFSAILPALNLILPGERHRFESSVAECLRYKKSQKQYFLSGSPPAKFRA